MLRCCVWALRVSAWADISTPSWDSYRPLKEVKRIDRFCNVNSVMGPGSALKRKFILFLWEKWEQVFLFSFLKSQNCLIMTNCPTRWFQSPWSTKMGVWFFVKLRISPQTKWWAVSSRFVNIHLQDWQLLVFTMKMVFRPKSAAWDLNLRYSVVGTKNITGPSK